MYIIQTYNSCVIFLFREATWSDWNYVEVKAGSDGCWSNVGMTGGRQDLNLKPSGCMSCRYHF